MTVEIKWPNFIQKLHNAKQKLNQVILKKLFDKFLMEEQEFPYLFQQDWADWDGNWDCYNAPAMFELQKGRVATRASLPS